MHFGVLVKIQAKHTKKKKKRKKNCRKITHKVSILVHVLDWYTTSLQFVQKIKVFRRNFALRDSRKSDDRRPMDTSPAVFLPLSPDVPHEEINKEEQDLSLPAYVLTNLEQQTSKVMKLASTTTTRSSRRSVARRIALAVATTRSTCAASTSHESAFNEGIRRPKGNNTNAVNGTRSDRRWRRSDI